jgi:hypothetical protein
MPADADLEQRYFGSHGRRDPRSSAGRGYKFMVAELEAGIAQRQSEPITRASQREARRARATQELAVIVRARVADNEFNRLSNELFSTPLEID